MRRYGSWAGNPKGDREDPERCIVEVGDGYLFGQCSFRRGKGPDGLYCGIHARRVAMGKHLYVPDDEAPPPTLAG